MLEFTAMHLVIEDNPPEIDSLDLSSSNDSVSHQFKDKYYSITLRKIDNEESFWLYARHGKEHPYSPTVTEKESQQEETNPRKTNQIELNSQLFAYYSKNDNNLLLSDSRQKEFFKKYLEKELNKKIFIKSFFVSADEFLKRIKTVSKIKFEAKQNLFNTEINLMNIIDHPQDVFGLGSDGIFSLEARFEHVKKTDVFKKFLLKLINLKKDLVADSLLCIGYDDNGIETIFNVDEFTQKIKIEGVKDENGMYDPNKILASLTKRIEDNKK